MVFFLSALAASWMVNARMFRMSNKLFENYYGIDDGLEYAAKINTSSEVTNASRKELLPRHTVHNIHLVAWNFTHYSNRQPRKRLRAKHQTSEANLTFNTSKSIEMKQLAVFYNAYISDEDPATAHRIIEEQIDKIGESYLASPHINTTIYYATLGRTLPDGFMDRVCTERNGLICQHLKHYKGGYEEVTLASLYDYCQNHSDERVVYFHSKGEKQTMEV